jgi:murein DD-endopeptidase MepM/ murein hydrolase activator NlpD
MYNNFYILPLVLMLYLSPVIAAELNPAISIFPENIYPGDVFVININSKNTPTAHFQGRSVNFYQANKGYKALGFVDINTQPGQYPLTINHSSQRITYNVAVKFKKFPVKNITLKSEEVFLSPENEKRADAEEAQLKSIWSRITRRPLWTDNFIKPIQSDITSPFGVKRIINKKKESRHRGTDYRAKTGTPIMSINAGIVALYDDHFFGGNTVVINHGLGLYSVYLHLSQTSVLNGDRVKKGDILGLVGSTGRSSGPHLHLSVKLNGESVNPESLYELDL